MNKTIDINCDLGEGAGNDLAVMPYISSCSIACGGHFGTKATIQETLRFAQDHQVNVGAHPAYPDQENFGRISMDISLERLRDSLRKQLDLFFSLCSTVNHIKPHGALYNDIFSDQEKATTVINVIKEYTPNGKVYCAPNSVFSLLAKQAGLTVLFEGFGDRAYTENAQLVSRKISGAVLSDKEKIATQVLEMITQQKVITIEGNSTPLNVQTVCMHGDGKNVVKHLHYLSRVLKENRIHVKAL